MSKIFMILSFIFLYSSCQETKTIYIASQMKDCQGVGPQKCLLVRESPEAEWQFFYDQIEGFEYEEGYKYKIKVSISSIKNPLEDGSSLQYKLIKVISKQKNQSIAQNTSEKQNDLEFEYEALSRGYFFKAKIDKNTITSFKDRNLNNKVSKDCSKSDWNTLLSLAEDIELTELSKLKAPGEKRFFDGAAHAILKVTSGNKTYISANFDHGDPPDEIKLLVNQILSLSESIE
ncbi:DUF4377 domain-containing protein [Aquimarina sp. RZ0]|uniref:DUF4377 domain-containing protein n=1 Tax=Aquimarina sp. RZ0 TaxID=2607730 RepID=UPI001CB74C5D|nr:DUF4377 domain-containing protein [Aquimarina sp. RZ0]